jgi:hypothetical protein
MRSIRLPGRGIVRNGVVSLFSETVFPWRVMPGQTFHIVTTQTLVAIRMIGVDGRTINAIPQAAMNLNGSQSYENYSDEVIAQIGITPNFNDDVHLAFWVEDLFVP